MSSRSFWESNRAGMERKNARQPPPGVFLLRKNWCRVEKGIVGPHGQGALLRRQDGVRGSANTSQHVMKSHRPWSPRLTVCPTIPIVLLSAVAGLLAQRTRRRTKLARCEKDFFDGGIPETLVGKRRTPGDRRRVSSLLGKSWCLWESVRRGRRNRFGRWWVCPSHRGNAPGKQTCATD